MSRFDAVFVGLTTLDIAGRPIRGIPAGGGVEFIEQIRLSPAGTACGAVMSAARLGISTAVVACLGDDEKGDFIAGVWRRLGIDGSFIQRTRASETSATILAIRPNGERPALHCRGASDHLFIDEADFAALGDTRFLHLGGSGLLAKMDSGQSARLLKWAHQRGIVTSVDLIAPNERTLELLMPMLPYTDYFMPSMEEAAQIAGLSEPEAIARFFLDRGVGTCIFKDGARGSWVFAEGYRLRIPAWQIRVVDTTGCGDSYCGAFIAGLARGLDVGEACRLGSAVASLVASGLGSDAGVVDWETTRTFMATAPTLPLSG